VTSPPFRDPRFAVFDYAFEPQPDGGLIIANPAPFFQGFITTNAALDHWAEAAPDRTWLAERDGGGWRRLSFAEARDQVARLAGALAGLGLGPGKPLLILAPNSLDHALIAYAAMRIGAPAAPVSPRYARLGADPARLAHAASLIGPAAVYVGDAAAAGEALASSALQGLPVIAARPAASGQYSLAALMREAAPVPDRARPGDAARLLLTSGSTGAPKAVICAHRNIALNAAQVAACFVDPDPPLAINSAPWSHSLGAHAVLHSLLHRGGTLYIDAGQPVPGRFDETLRNLAEISPTYQNMVPAGWALLAPALERDAGLARRFFRDVRLLQYSGAGLAQDLCDRIQAVARRTIGAHVTFAAGYGATETGPAACTVHWRTVQAGLIGLPIPGTQVKLTPEAGRLELCVRGPQLSPGYFDARRQDEPILPLPLDADGFCRMGDAARLIDPARPLGGLAFDGRLAENFKLAAGAFVNAGALRLAALSALGGAALDAVVCGEGRDGVGLLLFVDPETRARLGEAALRDQIRAGLERLNAAAGGMSGRVERAMILNEAPDAASGEITDKGYINQALARRRRAPLIEQLFSRDASVILAPGSEALSA
jgi:feruloyl-CoA synthase